SIDSPYGTSRAVYRITLKDDSNPRTAFAQDDRQEVKNVKEHTFELHVKAIKTPTAEDTEKEIGKEFLSPCYFLDCDNGKVKKLAQQAVGDESEELDAWRKAKLIEAWVYRNVSANNAIPFCPASQVATKLKGDCRQHSMLAAAMCRAAGVPSR